MIRPSFLAAATGAIGLGLCSAAAAQEIDPEAFAERMHGMPTGAALRECEECPEMVYITGGVIEIGTRPDEQGHEEIEGPVRAVTIAPFALGRTEVTVAEFRAFIEATAYAPSPGCNYLAGEWTFDTALSWADPGFEQDDSHPVTCVSADDAEAYVAWLNRLVGADVYRLPSEAEFEFAASGGSDTAFFWGDDREQGCDFANVGDATGVSVLGWDPSVNLQCADGFAYTAPVSALKPNAFGLFHIIGNVSEYVADCWREDYVGAPLDGSAWRDSATMDCSRVPIRGAAWSSFPEFGRSAARSWTSRDFPTDVDGFRVARSLSPAL